MKPYLSFCTTYKNHASYLPEWIEFHRLMGGERFFLYDNGSSDDHLEVLAPYLESGHVVIHRWHGLGRQHAAYEHCLHEHREDSRWIAFIDVDEFLFSPTGQPLPEVLRDFESASGVVVNTAVFGTSGHSVRPPGLVIENYLYRRNSPHFRVVKSIVDPTRAIGCPSAHFFVYSEGFAVDETGRRVDSQVTESLTFDLLRINHYYTKSQAEFEEKWSLPRPDTGEMREPERLATALANADWRRPIMMRDESLLKYVTPIRQALERGHVGSSST